MSDKTYNGWSNYATWRVKLEMFDGMSAEDVTGNPNASPYELRDALREMAEQIIEDTSTEGPARDYAYAFLADVNWLEIGNSMTEEEWY